MTDDKSPEGLRGPGLFVIYHWSFVIDHFDPGRSFFVVLCAFAPLW